jgi:hypothetical protein
MSIRKFRDSFHEHVPAWLQNVPGLDVGYRLLWSLVAPLDALFETAFQGVLSGRPGYNPTAFGLIGRSRGIVRGADDTDDEYAARLRAWLDTWRQAGRAECLARQLHEVLPGRPRVRIVSRLGTWVTVSALGVASWLEGVSLNWDSLSHPERTSDVASWWSEMWIIIEDPWDYSGATIGDAGLLSGRTTGLGHLCRQEDVDLVKGLILQWKSAHTYVRAVIWSKDPTDFDPTNLASLPDGRWGEWSIDSGKDTVPSPRDSTTTRYWEPF